MSDDDKTEAMRERLRDQWGHKFVSLNGCDYILTEQAERFAQSEVSLALQPRAVSPRMPDAERWLRDCLNGGMVVIGDERKMAEVILGELARLRASERRLEAEVERLRGLIRTAAQVGQQAAGGKASFTFQEWLAKVDELCDALKSSHPAHGQELLAHPAEEPQRPALPADIANAIRETLGEFDDEHEEETCRRCGAAFSLDDGCDPTEICHHCAQEVAVMLAKHIRDMGPIQRPAVDVEGLAKAMKDRFGGRLWDWTDLAGFVAAYLAAKHGDRT